MDFKQLTKLFLFSRHFIFAFLLIFSQMIAISFSQVLIKTNAFDNNDKIRFTLMAFMISLIFGAVIKTYCFFVLGGFANLHSETSLEKFVLNRWNDWIVTEVRAQVRVLLRLFLLIIPGIIEAVRLSLALPYVFLDKRMKDPQFDPVLESRKQLPFGSPLLIPLFIFTIILPTVVFALTNSEKIIFESSINLFIGALAALAQSVGVIISYSYVINAYIITSSNTKSNTASDTKGDL